jgi:hypothetical protein
MSLLESAKFWTEDENPKEKVKFLKGGEIPMIFAPGGGHIPGTPAYCNTVDVRRGAIWIKVHYRYFAAGMPNFWVPMLWFQYEKDSYNLVVHANGTAI